MEKPDGLGVQDRILALREGGHVRRCHVVPHHGEYTTGLHSYHAVSILLVLNPNASKELIRALLWHDVAERWIGDMPGPAKMYDDVLGPAYEDAERAAEAQWVGRFVLTDEEIWWLKSIDRLELMYWVFDQINLGNNHVKSFIAHLCNWFGKHRENIPPAVRDVFFSFTWKRLPEIKDGYV